MSTYNRPEFLKAQITSLLKQTFHDFEIIISDNDPNGGAKVIADFFNDDRIKYSCNGENLGIIHSYNGSMNRAKGKYIVIVTDDDPIATDFLSVFYKIVNDHPGYSIYGGFKRSNRKANNLEVIDKDDFISEILDPAKTSEFILSSCLFDKQSLMQVGKFIDYKSPHLADHVMLAMAGSIKGGIVINRVRSNIFLHQSNFSKSNFDLYFTACVEVHNLIAAFAKHKPQYNKIIKSTTKHLGKWFLVNIFNLLNFHKSAANYNKNNVVEIMHTAEKILGLPYMRSYRFKYQAKLFILYVKFGIGIKV